MSAAVVLVTHQTRGDVLAALDGLQAAGADGVVVVDCGSTDGTAAAVRDRGVTVVALPNVGYARGANAGVAALRAGCDAVVVANADVRFAPGSVTALAAALRDDVVAAGPLVTFPDGTPQASARAVPDLRVVLGHGLLGRVRPDNRWTATYHRRGAPPDEEIGWLSGCALALSLPAFRAVGGFDPRYRLGAEDVDLCLRLRDAGGRLVQCAGARVTHRVGASTSQRPAAAVHAHADGLARLVSLRALTGRRRWLRPAAHVAAHAWAASVRWWRRRVGPEAPSTGERLRESTPGPP